jgi:CDP-paratose 2-epimerase
VTLKSVIITGCAGFIGAHLAEYFLRQGAIVVGIDNLSRAGSQTNLEQLRNRYGNCFHFHKQDIRHFAAVRSIFAEAPNPELVIHQAAQVAVTTSITDPREDFEINALGTFNILGATRLQAPDAFFEFASTNKVYGKMDDLEIIERGGRYDYANLPHGIDETRGLDFHSPYGCSKGAADQYVRDYSRVYGLRSVVLRQSCIYGTRQFGVEDQGWVAWFTIASVLGKPITIYGDDKQGRDLLWIDDLVRVYAGLYEHADKTAGEIYNVGGGPENVLSLLELVEQLRSASILRQPAKFDEWRQGDQKIFVSDIRKLSEAIDWKSSVSPREGVDRLIAWSTSNKELLNRLLS